MPHGQNPWDIATDELARLRAERDALREACEKLIESASRSRFVYMQHDDAVAMQSSIDAARAALALCGETGRYANTERLVLESIDTHLKRSEERTMNASDDKFLDRREIDSEQIDAALSHVWSGCTAHALPRPCPMCAEQARIRAMPDLPGANLIFAQGAELARLRAERDALLSVVQRLRDIVEDNWAGCSPCMELEEVAKADAALALCAKEPNPPTAPA